MRARTAIASLAAATAAIGTLVATAGGLTLASFTATTPPAAAELRAATVKLGQGGAGPDLTYPALQPGHTDTVRLVVQYVGTIPADLSLSFAPGSSATLCGPGGAAKITLALGKGAPVDYCSLLDGTALPIAANAAPGSTTTVPVQVTLAADAAPTALGLQEGDIATVHADGGFTDAAKGQITLTTAPPAPTVTPTTPPPTDPAAAPADAATAASIVTTTTADVLATSSEAAKAESSTVASSSAVSAAPAAVPAAAPAAEAPADSCPPPRPPSAAPAAAAPAAAAPAAAAPAAAAPAVPDAPAPAADPAPAAARHRPSRRRRPRRPPSPPLPPPRPERTTHRSRRLSPRCLSPPTTGAHWPPTAESRARHNQSALFAARPCSTKVLWSSPLHESHRSVVGSAYP